MANEPTVKLTLNISSCVECPNHTVESDPDPYDSFCSDDCAVLCKLAPNDKGQTRWYDKRVWEHRPVTESCRPYRMKAETHVPKWCPMRGE